MSEEQKLPPLTVLLNKLKEDAATLEKAAEIIYHNKPLYVELVRREWHKHTTKEITDQQAERMAILGHGGIIALVEHMEQAIGMTERGEADMTATLVKVEELHTPSGTKH